MEDTQNQPNKPDSSSDGVNGSLSHLPCGGCMNMLKVIDTQIAADGVPVYYLDKCNCGIENVRKHVRFV